MYHAFVSILAETVAWLCHEAEVKDESDKRLLDLMCPLFRIGLVLAAVSAALFLLK